VLLDGAGEVHRIVGLDLLDGERTGSELDLLEVLDLGDLQRDGLLDDRILPPPRICLGRAAREVDEGAGRRGAWIVEPVIQRDGAQVVVHAYEVALDDRDGLDEVVVKARAVVLEVHARRLLDLEVERSNGEPARGAKRKGQREAAIGIRAPFADLPPGEPVRAPPELEVLVVNRRSATAVAGKDDAPDEAAVAVSGRKLRPPWKQPGAKTLPDPAQPPVLLVQPLDRDRERTVDDLRPADLEMVDAAQPGLEERIPLQLVTDAGLALAPVDDFACGIGWHGGLVSEGPGDRRRTWRACPFPWPPARRAA
jgi:hypothetical protein